MTLKAKPVFFDCDADMKLLKYIKTLPDFSAWVKERLAEEVQYQEEMEAGMIRLKAASKKLYGEKTDLNDYLPTAQKVGGRLELVKPAD